MNLEISTFLRKLLASMYQKGIREIPFAGMNYNAGVQALQTSLEEIVTPETYDKISDVFVKTPVQEEYSQLQDMLIELNGDIIGFVSLENPYWRELSIKMTPRHAEKILEEETDLPITIDQYSDIVDSFCDAAGVDVWARF